MGRTSISMVQDMYGQENGYHPRFPSETKKFLSETETTRLGYVIYITDFTKTFFDNENYFSITKILAKAGDRTRDLPSFLRLFGAPRGREKIVTLSIKTNNDNLSKLALTI